LAGIKDIQAREALWKEQNVAQGGGEMYRLFLGNGDRVFFNNLWTGEDGDPMFESYISHEYPAQRAGQWSQQKLCPVQSGFDVNYDCPGCRDDVKFKRRMAMWFYVTDILYAAPRENEQLPTTNYNGQIYFHRSVNGFRLWDTSAWKESPHDTFMENAHQGYLLPYTWHMHSSGANKDRRYKANMMPNTPGTTPELIAKARAECVPIKQWLMDQLNAVPTVAAPAAGGTFQPPSFQTTGMAPAPAPVSQTQPAFQPTTTVAAAPAPFSPGAQAASTSVAAVAEPPAQQLSFEAAPDAENVDVDDLPFEMEPDAAANDAAPSSDAPPVLPSATPAVQGKGLF
jgi:hypothetical protein